MEGDGGGHAVAYLAAPITIEIPLSTIQVGDTFSVMAALKAVAPNHRQRESYLSAYLRDPKARTACNGRTRSRAGGDARDEADALDSPRRGRVSEWPGPSGRPARFRESATFDEPELAGDGATVVITRSGGSKGAVSALLTTADGTALAGTDYLSVSTPVLFADGESGQPRPSASRWCRMRSPSPTRRSP